MKSTCIQVLGVAHDSVHAKNDYAALQQGDFDSFHAFYSESRPIKLKGLVMHVLLVYRPQNYKLMLPFSRLAYSKWKFSTPC